MDLQKKLNQIKEEVVEKRNDEMCQEELEEKVRLESLQNQTKEQQEILKNNIRELIELERNKKRSIEQLDQQIRIKRKKIAELGRQEMLKKQQLGEVMQKVKTQKRVLESHAQRFAEINNEEEEGRLKKVVDKERALRIEIAQKETVERETTRKEFELELELVKKSIAEGCSKLKKTHRLAKPTGQAEVNQSIQSGLYPRPPPSALPAQPSQLVRQFYNQQKLLQQQIQVQNELVRRATAAVNANLLFHPPAATSEFDSSFNTTTPASPICVIPEMVQSSSSPSESTTSCPVPVNSININQRPNSNNTSSVICYAPSTSKLAPIVTTATSNLFIPKTFTLPKSSATTFPPISTVASTSANSSTSTSPAFNLDKLSPIYSKLILSATTSALPNSSAPLSLVTSQSFSANLDKPSSTVAKSVNFDNGIEIITIDDSDDDDEEEMINFDNSGTIEDNETSNSINQIQKKFSTLDELIDVNHIGGNDIAPVGTTAAAVKPMDNFVNETTNSTDKVIERLVPETSIQNLDLGNDYESVDDQFELVGGQNDNQQPKFTSKTNNNRLQIKTKRLSKLRNNEKRNEERQQSLEQCRGHYYLRKKQPTLQQNEEEEPEQQQQNSQTSSELNEMGQNGKLRSDTDIDNRATLKSKENGRGRKRKRNGGGGVETSEQSKRERHLAQKREWIKQKRANETPEERELRLTQKREKRANETPEQREHRLKDLIERQKKRLEKETPEEKKRRLAQIREKRANGTPREREHRQAQIKEYEKQRLANETPEERENRLAQKREYEKQRLANETPEERENRMAQKREYDKQRLANETPEQRERRLKYHCEYYKEIIANKTPQQPKYRN